MLQTWEFWFFLSVPVYMIGAWTISNWMVDNIYFRYRLYRERKWRRKYN